MDDGRRILAELQHSDWAAQDLDYDAVMAGLAAGHSALSLIARDPHPTTRPAYRSLFVRTSERDHQLLGELTAIARAPYLAAPWPPEPAIPMERLVADFERTTVRRLQLRLRWDNYPDGGVWVCEVSIDGRPHGWTGVGLHDDAGDETLVEVADRLCESFLHEEIWGGWPMCFRHPSRPMWAQTDDDGTACWVCEADPADRVRIGQLGL